MYLPNKFTKWYLSLISQAKARNTLTGYFEMHHIIPKCLGGSNDTDNLVALTAREHFVAHRLLTKMVEGRARHQMYHAMNAMLLVNHNQAGRIINSRLVAKIRQDAARATSERRRGVPMSLQARAKLSKSRKGTPSPNKGKAMAEETKAKIAASLAGRAPSPETVRKIHDSRKGYRHSEETKKKISESNRGKTVVHSEETRRKISRALAGVSKPFAKGREPWNKGVSHSENSIQKMREAHSNREMKTCHCGKTVPSPNYSRWHGDRCRISDTSLF